MITSKVSCNLNIHQIRALIRRLNELCKFLDKAYDINSGGCCYTCYLISKKLEELGVDYKLVICDCEFDDDTDSRDIERNIKCRDLDSISCGDYVSSHYMIKINDQIINSDHYDDDPKIEVEVNSNDIKWIYNTGDWNSTYNIRLNGILKTYINTLFNAFKIEFL